MRHAATVAILLSILVSLAGCSFPPASRGREPVRPAQTYEITVDFYSSEPKQQPKDTSVLKEATGPLAIVSGVTALAQGTDPTLSVLGLAAAHVANRFVERVSTAKFLTERLCIPVPEDRPFFFQRQRDGTVTAVIGPPLERIAEHPDVDPAVRAWLDAIDGDGRTSQPPSVRPE